MIKQSIDKPLNIYRASAGSGKTHLLTGFYLKQLFLSELLPETHSGEMHFSEILAVTFTNKATAEMKGRIIDELFLLSQTPRKSDYWKEINPGEKKSEKQISQKATDLLVQVLNEYSSFNISTIDSFFQKIVRSFARELNVPGNYEIELNSKEVIESAIASFLDKLDPQGNSSTFNWMVNFTDKRSEEGEGWDLRSKLFGITDKVLNSEEYRQHSQQIQQFTHDKKRLLAYESMLKGIVRDWRKQLKEIGQKGLDLMTQYEVTKEELANGGSGTTSHFAAWAKGEEKSPLDGARFKELMDDHSKLFKKTSDRQCSELSEQLCALLEAGRDLFTGDLYTHYVTASVIQQEFYELGIIANIDEELKNYCNERNIMLLNSTTEMLTKLIGPDDAPFIYEKTGTHIKSYMIDEFQDTSGMQWHNFTPLISNSLSQQYQNLIVGDVKQSIYRWRGSDWSLLDSQINHYATPWQNDEVDDLTTNWRSLPAIVEFNNRFFEDVASQLDAISGTSQVSRIYKDVKQEIPGKKTRAGNPVGMVHIEHLMPKDEAGEVKAKANKEDYLREALLQLPLQIIRLQQQGFEPRDIAILCRRGYECQLMAQTLLEYKQQHPECPYSMDIISSEALQLSARPVIQTVISMMQLILNPKSEIQKAVTWSNYLQLDGLTPHEALAQYLQQGKEHLLLDPQIAYRPLYELTEILIDKLPSAIVTEEAPFLQAFRDIVLDFSHSHSGDLSAFLEWWNTTGSTKTIATPDTMNAIQIMTIHKSKGLGLPAIIIPFASWDMDIDTSHGEILWCEPKVEPFRQEILLPVKLEKRLEDTIFCDDFAEERLRSIIDNLNTAYVAFTRAKEAMVIMIPASNSQSQLESLIDGYVSKLTELDTFCQSGEISIPIAHEGCGIAIGQWGRAEQKEKAEESVIALAPVEHTSAHNMLPELSILHSPLEQDPTARKKGNCVHRVLQELQTAQGYESIVHRLYTKRIIDPELITEEEMMQKIGQILAIPEVASWFRPGLTVLNEQNIMDSQGNLIRPDRVVLDPEGNVTVIDYKTGTNHAGYGKKVREYKTALRDLGFRNIRGYLFFIKDSKIMEVKGFTPQTLK